MALIFHFDVLSIKALLVMVIRVGGWGNWLRFSLWLFFPQIVVVMLHLVARHHDRAAVMGAERT